jgi:hypothetical protein
VDELIKFATVDKTQTQALLKKAAFTIGIEQLAAGLKVPLPLLRAWIDGHATMPDRKFLALADLLERTPGRK